MADLKHAEGEVISATKLNGVVDRLPSFGTGEGAVNGRLHPSWVRLRNDGTVRDLGEIVAFNQWDGPTNVYVAKGEAIHTPKNAVWHSAIANLAVIIEPIPANKFGDASAVGEVIGKFSELDFGGVRTHAQVDPNNPKLWKAATGGPARIINTIDGQHAVIEMGNPQNLWKYETNAELGQGAGSVQAKLKELDGKEYATVTLKFPAGRTDCALPEGTEGFCMQTGNDFHAISTTSAFMGKPKNMDIGTGEMKQAENCSDGNVCFVQTKIPAQVFSCLPQESIDNPDDETNPPENVLCINGKEFLDCLNICEYICTYCDSYTVADLTCTPDCCGDCWFPDAGAIEGLTVTWNAETFSQNGESTKVDDCCHEVPMDNDGGTVTVCYDGASGWTADGGPIGSPMSGSGPCSGAVSVDDGAGNDASFTSNGEARASCKPPPPPGECCVDCNFDEATLTLSVPGRSMQGPAARIDDCCFDVDMDNGTWSVCYEGGGDWTATGPESESHTGNGDCTGASLSGGASVSVEGAVVCTEPDCCQFSDVAYIENFSAEAGDISISSPDQHTIQGGGECGAQVSFVANYDDQNTQETGTANVTIELKYQNGTCVWEVTISGATIPNKEGEGTFIAAEGCTGTMCCEEPAGDCGVNYTTGCFDVVDPQGNPTCVAPTAFDERPGNMLKSRAPELFGRGCGCGSSDTVALMNAWGCAKSRERLGDLAAELRRGVSKSKIESVRTLPDAALRAHIVDAIDAEEQRLKALPK